MNIMTSLEKTTQSTLFSLATGELNQNCMAKSKRMTKSDYIEQLCDITRHHAKRLKVNQIKELITKHGKLND